MNQDFCQLIKDWLKKDEKINYLINELDTVVKLSNFNETSNKVKYLEKIAGDARREALRQELYNKRHNLLVDDIDDRPDTVTENKLQTQMKLYEVFKERLEIDLNSITDKAG